jgi:hypothetical protein
MPVSDQTIDDRFCLGCGYNLHGLASDRCPECGLAIDAGGDSRIPWDARHQMGSVRAFRRTMFEAMFRVKRLARAAAHPLADASAIQFRLIVSFLAAAPIVALFGGIGIYYGGLGYLSLWQPHMPGGFEVPKHATWEIPILWSAGATLWPVLPIGLFISAYLCTGLLGYWVRGPGMSDEQKRRAVVASAYVCAPLALSIIPTAGGFALAWSMWNLQGHFFYNVSTACLVFGYATTLVILAIYQINAVSLISALTHDDGWIRKAFAIVGIPLCWVVAALMGLVIFPMLIGLIWLMIDSLRP